LVRDRAGSRHTHARERSSSLLRDVRPGEASHADGQAHSVHPGANHAQLIFEVIGPDGKTVLDPTGKPVVWGVETGPAAQIAERGITVASFPTGTIMTATLYPLRNGKTFGSLARGSAIIKCGTTLPKDGCNAKTGESFLDDRGGN
jgi:hypothetical protein